MPDFTVTKRFHSAEGANLPGDVVTSIIAFHHLDAAIKWGENVNLRYSEFAYHVCGAVQNSRNFCMFDLSKLSDEIIGFDDLPFNDIKQAA